MKHTIRLRSFLSLAGSSLLAISSANALTLTWDADTGTSGAQDGGGNWIAGGTTFWNGSTNVATTNNITADSPSSAMAAPWPARPQSMSAPRASTVSSSELPPPAATT